MTHKLQPNIFFPNRRQDLPANSFHQQRFQLKNAPIILPHSMSAEARKALEALRIEAEAAKSAERVANYSTFVNILSKSYDSRSQEEHIIALNLFSELCPFFPPVPSHLQTARQSALEHSYPHFSYNLFSRGSTLCTAGTLCKHVIFILKGSVNSERLVTSSSNSTQTNISAGNIIGEIEAVRSDGRWESTLIGAEKGEYLSINKSAFARLFELGTYVSLSEATMLMRIKGFHRLGSIETLMTLCTGIQRKIFSAGTLYLKEGDPMTSTVLVKDGSIRVCRSIPDETRSHEKSDEPFNFHEYRSHFFKPSTDKEHLVTLSMVGRDEMLCYPFKQGSATPTSEFTYIVHTGSVLLILNLDQFKGKLNISTLGRSEIRKYMAKIDGQRMGRCSSFSKASEFVGSMMQDRSETIPWQESFAARDETIVPPVILPELIGSPSKSKIGQNTALDHKIGHEQFAALSTKLINMRKVSALSLDSAAVSDTYSYAAVSKAQNFQKNQYDKNYQARMQAFNEYRKVTADYSFSNLPENSGFSLLLRRSMELIGSFEEGSLAHAALSPQSANLREISLVRS
jgi:CRP-like cAMP-binding protein